MNPVKFKEVINETAQRLEQKPELVAAVLQLYFKELRLSLTTLSHPRVQLFNLGTFQLKPGVLEKKLSAKCLQLQKCSDSPSRSPGSTKEQLEHEIAAMQRTLTTIHAEKQRKQSIKQSKNHEQ